MARDRAKCGLCVGGLVLVLEKFLANFCKDSGNCWVSYLVFVLFVGHRFTPRDALRPAAVNNPTSNLSKNGASEEQGAAPVNSSGQQDSDVLH